MRLDERGRNHVLRFLLNCSTTHRRIVEKHQGCSSAQRDRNASRFHRSEADAVVLRQTLQRSAATVISRDIRKHYFAGVVLRDEKYCHINEILSFLQLFARNVWITKVARNWREIKVFFLLSTSIDNVQFVKDSQKNLAYFIELIDDRTKRMSPLTLRLEIDYGGMRRLYTHVTYLEGPWNLWNFLTRWEIRRSVD